jgi:hypothetical protein
VSQMPYVSTRATLYSIRADRNKAGKTKKKPEDLASASPARAAEANNATSSGGDQCLPRTGCSLNSLRGCESRADGLIPAAAAPAQPFGGEGDQAAQQSQCETEGVCRVVRCREVRQRCLEPGDQKSGGSAIKSELLVHRDNHARGKRCLIRGCEQERSHLSVECPTLMRFPLPQRWAIINQANLCELCFKHRKGSVCLDTSQRKEPLCSVLGCH